MNHDGIVQLMSGTCVETYLGHGHQRATHLNYSFFTPCRNVFNFTLNFYLLKCIEIRSRHHFEECFCICSNLPKVPPNILSLGPQKDIMNDDVHSNFWRVISQSFPDYRHTSFYYIMTVITNWVSFFVLISRKFRLRFYTYTVAVFDLNLFI